MTQYLDIQRLNRFTCIMCYEERYEPFPTPDCPLDCPHAVCPDSCLAVA